MSKERLGELWAMYAGGVISPELVEYLKANDKRNQISKINFVYFECKKDK